MRTKPNARWRAPRFLPSTIMCLWIGVGAVFAAAMLSTVSVVVDLYGPPDPKASQSPSPPPPSPPKKTPKETPKETPKDSPKATPPAGERK